MLNINFSSSVSIRNVISDLALLISHYSGDEVKFTYGNLVLYFVSNAPERKVGRVATVEDLSNDEIVQEYQRRFGVPRIAHALSDVAIADEYMRRVKSSESFRKVLEPMLAEEIKENLAGIIDEILEEISKGD